MIPINGSGSFLRSDFDGFLFAPVGEDSGNSGMPLSVLSALARQDVDPWEEAASLACLPSETAIQRLTMLIAALPDGRSTRLDPGAVAARLIALLPHGKGSVIRSRTARQGVRTVTHAWPVKYIIAYWIFMLFILGAQWLAVNHLVAAQAATAAKPMPGAVVSQALPRNADQ
jgi:hypothetical protein